MQLFLQAANELSEDIYWVLGAVIVVLICYFYWLRMNKSQRQRRERLQGPREDILNQSNYNISRTGIDDHRTENMSAEEAKNLVDGMKSEGDIPTDEEFHRLRRSLRKS